MLHLEGGGGTDYNGFIVRILIIMWSKAVPQAVINADDKLRSVTVSFNRSTKVEVVKSFRDVFQSGKSKYKSNKYIVTVPKDY